MTTLETDKHTLSLAVKINKIDFEYINIFFLKAS